MYYSVNYVQGGKTRTDPSRNRFRVFLCGGLASVLSIALASCSTLKPGTSLVGSVHHLDLHGKAAIVGVVRDSGNGQPLMGASIILTGTTQCVTTDKRGSYTIPNIPPGKYTVKAAMIGYATCSSAELSLTDNSIVVLDFSMSGHRLKGVLY